MQQMLFASPAAWTGSDSSSARRVTFAVQNAPPSPVVYRRGQERQRDESPYAQDLVEETTPVPQRRQQPRRAYAAQQRVVTARLTAAAQTRTRRPGWDDGVGHGSTLFDASLKKSLLFQPRAGDRREEEKTEKQEIVSVVPRQRASATASRKKRSATPVRYRSGPSSVYAQQRQNVTHWPQRRMKDFVRQNIEHLTGQPANARSGRSAPRSAVRENVFERLSAPRVSKALLRSHMLPFQAGSKQIPAIGRSPSASSLSPPRPAPLSSPAPEQQESSSPSPTVRRPGLGWSSPYSSPQRSQQSSSPRRSPKSSTRSSGGESRRRQYDSYPARVFGVLDREQEQRIGVDQILQGLRLLGLPATLNQISDYVYLIHEGRHNTIDLEEWEILVGTLDAASRPASNSPRSAHATQSSAMRHSPRSAYTSQSAMPSRSLPSRSFSERSPYSAYHSPLELNNNQAESESNHSSPDHILKHTTPAVNSLQQVSISPLVHQAEASLRQIQQRRGSKLSLFLHSGDMAVISQNSDMLATAILDDILLDTVQLLNDEDRQQTCRQLQAHQAGQLDDIMARILEIEREENSLVQQGLSLGYAVTRANCDLPTASFHGSPSQATTKPDPTENLHLPNLTLPLEVVMNLHVPDSPPAYQGPTAGEKGECIGCTKLHEDDAVLDGPSITSLLAEHPVTSILQGKRLQSIERRKNKFQHHRRLVESSLAETGMAQYAVIEILEEMLLDDLVEQTTTELNDTVLSMSDILMTSLL